MYIRYFYEGGNIFICHYKLLDNNIDYTKVALV